MTDKAAIRELREKVEKGQIAPSDFELMASAVFDRRTLRFATSAELGSLDAALALHEAVLPGWTIRLTALTPHGNSAPYVHVFRMRQTEDDPVASANSSGYSGKDPARAWLISILKAMESGNE